MTDFLPAPTDPPPSPFLPGTDIQYAIDSTSLGYLKTCPRLYQYVMIEGWASKEESIHLRFGGEYHQALQDYDLTVAEGVPHDDAVFDVVRELLIRTSDWKPDLDSKAGKYKNRDSLLRAVIWYLEGTRKNDNYKTHILANGKPAVELSFRFELAFGPEGALDYEIDENGDGKKIDRQPYILCGHLDRVVDDGAGNLYVEDHKTTTTTPGSYFFDQFEPNNQMSLYTFAAQIILEAPIKGVIINAAQMLVDDCRFVRGFTFRTPDQLEEWVMDLSRWLAQAEWYASNQYWPQNDMSCGMYGGCRFREICSKSPSVREIYLKSNFTKLPPEERWNPLKSR